MVSSGISNSISPVRPVEASKGNSAKNPEVEFGVIMSQQQTAAAGSDLAKNQSVGQSVQNTKTLMNTAPKTEERVRNASAADKTNKADKADKAAISDKPAKVSEVSDKVKEVTDDIKDKIKKEFDVTDEDIEKALEALGMVMTDLLDEGNLTDFVVELTGMDSAVDLLVSPEISNQLSDVSDFIRQTMAELSEELDIPVDELADLLKAAQAQSGMGISDEHAKQTAETDGEAAAGLTDGTVEAVQAQAERRVKTDDRQPEADGETETVSQEPKEIAVKAERPQDKSSSENSGSGSHSELTGKDHSEPAVNPIVNHFTNAVNEAFEMQGLDERINPVQIIEQIVEAAKITLNQQVTTMELLLNPESLGKINMTISVKEGVVTAALAAQNEAAKQAIESQLVILKENLNNQGLKVEAVEVTVESHAFDANANQNPNNGFDEQREQAQKKNNRPLRLDSLEDLNTDELTEEERIVMDMMANEGNQINFTA